MTGRLVGRPVEVVTRRRFLQIGGTLSMGAVLAACIGGGSSKRSRDSSGGAGGRRADATITRTFSSVEAVAVVVYTTALDSGLLTTPAMDVANLFRSHHREHAALFVGTTRDLGGAPFTDPNPVVMQQVQPVLDGLRAETTAVNLALDVETILSDTYQATMGTFADKSFNVAAMSVGGAEARHAAALAQAIGVPPVLQAFETTDRAVPAGNGV
jgi:Ferritin-like domain